MPVCARQRLFPLLVVSLLQFGSFWSPRVQWNQGSDRSSGGVFPEEGVFGVAYKRCTGEVFFLCISTHFRLSCCSTCGLVQREQRLHVVFLALDFVRSFQDARFDHRLRPGVETEHEMIRRWEGQHVGCGSHSLPLCFEGRLNDLFCFSFWVDWLVDW